MAKRIQLDLDDDLYREIQGLAHSRRISLAKWIRQALDRAREQESVRDPTKKLEVIRVAAQYKYPVGDIRAMLAEVSKDSSAG
jgi:hypothetical protein